MHGETIKILNMALSWLIDWSIT